MSDLPEEVRELMRQRRTLAEAVVVEGGPLEEYLRRLGVDPETAVVYLFGSSATGRPYKDAYSGGF